MNTPTTFDTLLGTNKGKPLSRVWIEGARLVAAGFTVGARYRRFTYANSICLILETSTDRPEDFYKVSGKGASPIIDITGKIITERFKGTHARVTYLPGEILIANPQG